MKLTTFVILAAALHRAYGQNVIVDGAIDGVSNGIVSARHTQIGEAQAKSEVGELMKYIASNPSIYGILDEIAASVLVGFDSDSFPPFVSRALASMSAYEQSPDFTTAKSLISSYLPHYDEEQAIINASSNNELFYNLFTENVNSIRTDAGVDRAVSAGLDGVSKLMSDLGLLGAPVPTSSAVVTSSSSSAVVTSETSSAVVTSETSSAVVTSETSSAVKSAGSSSVVVPTATSTEITTSSGEPTFSGVPTATSDTTETSFTQFPSASSETSQISTPQSSDVGPIVTVTTAESITSTITQTVTHCDEDKCTTPTLTLTTVVPTNHATTTIVTVHEGVTVTITVPCDTTSEGPKPTATEITPTPQTTVVVEPPTTKSQSTEIITLTQTVTLCDETRCITPVVTYTTQKPVETQYTVPSEGPSGGPVPSVAPSQSPVPTNPGQNSYGPVTSPTASFPDQANGASMAQLSVAAALAGVMVLLI